MCLRRRKRHRARKNKPISAAKPLTAPADMPAILPGLIDSPTLVLVEASVEVADGDGDGEADNTDEGEAVDLVIEAVVNCVVSVVLVGSAVDNCSDVLVLVLCVDMEVDVVSVELEVEEIEGKATGGKVIGPPSGEPCKTAVMTP